MVPGTLGFPSVPTGVGWGSLLFRLISHCMEKMKSHLRLNTLEPVPRMLVQSTEQIRSPHMPQAPDTLRYSY